MFNNSKTLSFVSKNINRISKIRESMHWSRQIVKIIGNCKAKSQKSKKNLITFSIVFFKYSNFLNIL